MVAFFTTALFSTRPLLEFVLLQLIRHCGGPIRHRMPLRCEFMPLLFGGDVGRVFGALLAADRFQMISPGQTGRIRQALKYGHSAAR
jgi:hypothetical protein